MYYSIKSIYREKCWKRTVKIVKVQLIVKYDLKFEQILEKLSTKEISWSRTL